MSERFFHLRVLGAARRVATTAAIEEAERELGLALPPSYKQFVHEYGYGLLCGLFIVYIPAPRLPECDRLESRSHELKDELLTAASEGWLRLAPDGDASLVPRLTPFGYSENGDILAWDSSESQPSGEFPIYVIGSRKSGVYKGAPDLWQFVSRATAPGAGGMLGRFDAQLEATFEPWSQAGPDER